MDLNSLSKFLSSSKDNVHASVHSRADVHVVLGNESVDLDSVVSSIVTAYYTAHSHCNADKTRNNATPPFVFAVINCSREELPLRTETAYFLKENGIRLSQLICRNEIDLSGYQRNGRLKLTLVDHNVLAHGDMALSASVHRVIDHHKRERPVDPRDTIEVVGSCCTLVAELVVGTFASDPVVCRLLYGTIVLDTYNFATEAQRTTPKDTKMAQALENALSASSSCPNSDELFKALVAARSNVSQLTPSQLFRKDQKVIQELAICLPSVPILSPQLLEIPNIFEELKLHMKHQGCTAAVVLCMRVGEGEGEIRKEIVVFAESQGRAKEICGPLENSSELDLQLIHNSTQGQFFLFAYHQRNVTLSRKFVLPFLSTHFGS